MDPTPIPIIKSKIYTKFNKDHANITFHRNTDVTWLNNCVQHVIWVEEVWEIRCEDIGETLGLKTLGIIVIDESNDNESGSLVTL